MKLLSARSTGSVCLVAALALEGHLADAATVSIDTLVSLSSGSRVSFDSRFPLPDPSYFLEAKDTASLPNVVARGGDVRPNDIGGRATVDASVDVSAGAIRAAALATGEARVGVTQPSSGAAKAGASLVEEFTVSGAGFADVAVLISGDWTLWGARAGAAVDSLLQVFNLGRLIDGAPALEFEDLWRESFTTSGSVSRTIATSFAVEEGDVIRVSYGLAVSATGWNSGGPQQALSGAMIDFGNTAKLSVEGDEGANLSASDPGFLSRGLFSATEVVRALPSVLATRGPHPNRTEEPLPPPVPLPAAGWLLAAGVTTLLLLRRRKAVG